MRAPRTALLAGVQLCLLLAGGRALAGDAHAAWSDLWRTPDQQGQALLDAGEPGAAAARFRDPRRRAYADLQANRYAQAASLLAPFSDVQSEYNRGNALAKANQLQTALAAYDAALKQSPADKDIRHNRDLVARALQQQQQSPKSTPGNGGQKGGKSGSSGQQQSGSGAQQSGAGGRQSAGKNSPSNSQPGGDAMDRSRQQSGQSGADTAHETSEQAQRDAAQAPRSRARSNSARAAPDGPPPRPSPLRPGQAQRLPAKDRKPRAQQPRNSSRRTSANWRSISGCGRSLTAPPVSCSASSSSST
jgi:Ca-activated chloride channel family protein